MMERCIKKISDKFPCRVDVIKNLYNYYGYAGEVFPQSVYLYGHTSTGKTVVLNQFLKLMDHKYVVINCIECYSPRILFELIINCFHNFKLIAENNFMPYRKIDCLKDFIEEVQQLDDSKSYIIVLENAEKLRDMDANIMPIFMRLQELTSINISTIFVSSLPFEKYFLKTGLPETIKIFVPDYSKKDICKIFQNNFPQILKHIQINAVSSLLEGNDDFGIKINLIEKIDANFYDNYLNIFLSLFFKACRDLNELQTISDDCFKYYYEPVLSGEIEANDVTKLWRNSSKFLKDALSTIYLRTDHTKEKAIEFSNKDLISTKKIVQNLDLPFYAKYLLIAAFLASHNPAKEDKRLYMKNHGKQRKRLQNVKAKAKVSEKLNTQLGPEAFTVDRLLAIFYAILDEKVGLTCHLLAQISTLISLKFIGFVSGENNIMEGSARLQCTVGLDFILNIGKMVGFNVRQYLCDFL